MVRQTRQAVRRSRDERFLDRLLVKRGELGQWFGSYRMSRLTVDTAAITSLRTHGDHGKRERDDDERRDAERDCEPNDA